MDTDTTVRVFADRCAAADYIIERWRETALLALAAREVFSVALSGGKTPVVLYDRLPAGRKDLPWDRTHIFFADERFVPADSPGSTSFLVQEHLLSRAGLARGHVHRVTTQGVTLEEAAKLYEDDLQTFFGKGLPRFDLILLGVGTDGHTASVFPPVQDHLADRRAVIPVIACISPHERISLTLEAINNARHVIMFAAGRSKAWIIREVLERKNAVLPAARVGPHAGELTCVLDAAAASLLSRTVAGTKVPGA